MSGTGAAEAAEVVVVGAGLAGLACALELQAREVEVVVLEASDGVGGRVRTDTVDGFRLDRGFQILLTAYPEAERVLDYGRLSLQPFVPGALVRYRGRFHRVTDPFRRPWEAWRTAVAPVGSVGDKLKVATLRRRLQAADPPDLLRAPETTTAARLADDFSPKLVDRFLQPLFSGIFCDPELETSSRMFDVLFRAFSGGDAAVPAAGMQAIPDQLAARLGEGTVRLGRKVTEVRADGVTTAGNGASGGTAARAVVVATEGPAAAGLTGVRNPGSRGVTSCWFAAEEAPMDEAALLLAGDSSGHGPIADVAVMSNTAPAYAPVGAALVVASAPGTVAPGVEDAVRTQLRSWFGAAVDGWRLLRTDRIAHALPDQSPPFSPKRSVKLASGVYVCGDHRDTGSIQGALYSGRRTAERVAADLTT